MDFDTFMNGVSKVVNFINENAEKQQAKIEKSVEQKLRRLSDDELLKYYNNHSSDEVREIAERVLQKRGVL